MDGVSTGQGGRLKNITVGSLMNLTYTYDKSGNLRKINSTATAIETQNFTYDTLDRLISANATSGPAPYSESYTYNGTTGNLATKGSLALQYNDSAHAHAVTNAGSNTYSYDSNGNQVTRVIGGQTYTLSYNAENQLVGVTGPSMSATFVYDGGGARVKSTINGTTTYFVGGHYEVTGSQVTKYYFAGSQRIAVRKNGTLSYMVSTSSTQRLSDHLGSTVATTNTSGQLVSGQLYKAWGEVRYSLGTSPTKYTFTGQYSNVSDFGLLFYNARWYDPVSGRFTSADTIVPPGFQGLDRYGYVRNSPLIYTDPSGHCEVGCWIGLAIALVVWLANPPTAYAPDQSWQPTVSDSSYGDLAYFDTAPGTGDLSDIYAAFTGRTLFTGEETNQVVAAIFAIVPVGTAAWFKQGHRIIEGIDNVTTGTRRISGPLSTTLKNTLRAEARTIFYKANPALEAMRADLRVHHRVPLEWAHLFPNSDPNSLGNLVGVSPGTHNLINGRWDEFRQLYKELGRSPTAQEVIEFAQQIDNDFSQFYNGAR